MAIKLTINGKKVAVEAGITILEAAQQEGVYIPTLCHEPTLDIYGGCRICVVEVEGARNLVASCTTPVTDGMVVHTESERVVTARREILRLLLDNHPNDCLTCDKAGKCKLQEISYMYGVRFEDHSGARHEYECDDSSPYIFRDMNKCILCGKCVRSCDQIEGRRILSFGNRGFETKVVTAFDKGYGPSDCVNCFRCVSVCPVGALMDKSTLGKGRPWEVVKEEVNCPFCSHGCMLELGKKNGKVVYVTPKAPGNGRPLCMKGKIGSELRHIENAEKPYLKINGEYVQVEWSIALGMADMIDTIKKVEK